MESFWSHLIATAVGGFIAIAGGFLAKIYSDNQERKALKSAHAGELRANLDFLREFDRIAELRKFIVKLEGQPYAEFFGIEPATYEYNKVFSSTANKLGMLSSPLPERIVRAHYELQLMFEIFENNSKMSRDASAYTHVNRLENLARHRDLLKRVENFCKSTADLINDLEGISCN